MADLVLSGNNYTLGAQGNGSTLVGTYTVPSTATSGKGVTTYVAPVSTGFTIQYLSSNPDSYAVYENSAGSGGGYLELIPPAGGVKHSSYYVYGQKVCFSGTFDTGTSPFYVNGSTAFGSGSTVTDGISGGLYLQVSNRLIIGGNLRAGGSPAAGATTTNATVFRIHKSGPGGITLSADNSTYSNIISLGGANQGSPDCLNHAKCIPSAGLWVRSNDTTSPSLPASYLSTTFDNWIDNTSSGPLTISGFPLTVTPPTSNINNSSGSPASIAFRGTNSLTLNTTGINVTGPATPFAFRLTNASASSEFKLTGTITSVGTNGAVSPAGGPLINKRGIGLVSLYSTNGYAVAWASDFSTNHIIEQGILRTNTAGVLGSGTNRIDTSIGGFNSEASLELDGGISAITIPATRNFRLLVGGGVRSYAGSNTINSNIDIASSTEALPASAGALSGSSLTLTSNNITSTGAQYFAFKPEAGTTVTVNSNSISSSNILHTGQGKTFFNIPAASVTNGTSLKVKSGTFIVSNTSKITTGSLSVSTNTNVVGSKTYLILGPQNSSISSATFSEGSYVSGGSLTSSGPYSFSGNCVIMSELLGSVSLTHSGSGSTLYLGSTNSYSGGTTVAAGATLVAGNRRALGQGAGDLTVQAGATLKSLNDSDQKGTVHVKNLTFGTNGSSNTTYHRIGFTHTVDLGQSGGAGSGLIDGSVTGTGPGGSVQISDLPVVETGKIVITDTLSFTAASTIYLENSNIYNKSGRYVLFDYTSGSFPGGQKDLDQFLNVVVTAPNKFLFKPPYIDNKKVCVVIL